MPNDEKVIEKYLKDIDELKDKVTSSAEVIKDKIDLNKLRSDPQQYIYSLSRQYYLSHEKDLKKAIQLGEKKAKGIIK